MEIPSTLPLSIRRQSDIRNPSVCNLEFDFENESSVYSIQKIQKMNMRSFLHNIDRLSCSFRVDGFYLCIGRYSL